MKELIILWFCCCGVVSAFELSSEEVRSQQEGLKKWNTIADSSVNMQKDEALKKLGQGVRKTSMRSIYSIDGTHEVFEKLRRAMLAIPGHADYFVDEIKNARAKSEAESVRRVRSGSKPTWSTYNNTRSNAFKILMHLPSVETARVLGGYLPDEEYLGEKITKNHLPDSFGPPENCRLALMALRHIIASKPFKPKPQYEVAPGELESWQLWHEQVKAGSRTFRLVGDSTEYDFNGPAPKKKLERIARNRTRDKNRLTGKRETALVQFEDSSESIKTDKTSIIGGVIAVGVLMLGAIGYFIRSKSRNTSR